MPLNTDHLLRCIGTLESACKFYGQAEEGSIDQEVFRNAIVKGYELTQETAFKLLKRVLKDYGHGGKKLDATPVKELLRLAATHSLMKLDEVERWFAYRDNRNNTAHDYGESFAKETLKLLPNFIDDAKTLEGVLRERSGGGESGSCTQPPCRSICHSAICKRYLSCCVPMFQTRKSGRTAAELPVAVMKPATLIWCCATPLTCAHRPMRSTRSRMPSSKATYLSVWM